MSSHNMGTSNQRSDDQCALELEQQVSLALALALELADAEDEHWDQARQRLVEFVEQLTLQQAQNLLAVVDLGQQAAASLESALAMVIASSQTQESIASRLARCGPLAKYLLAGLENWRAQRAAELAAALSPLDKSGESRLIESMRSDSDPAPKIWKSLWSRINCFHHSPNTAILAAIIFFYANRSFRCRHICQVIAQHRFQCSLSQAGPSGSDLIIMKLRIRSGRTSLGRARST